MGWFCLMSVLGILGMYDFNAWMIDYGTNLDPHAIMKLANPDGTPMSYSPPLFGHQKMLNFDVDSYPHIGAYMMSGYSLIPFSSSSPASVVPPHCTVVANPSNPVAK